MKHKHYDCIVAWAGGAKIEISCDGNSWDCVKYPSWDPNYFYRIKKEPVIEVKYFQFIEYYNGISYKEFIPDLEKWHLKITYQDGKAIKAELPE